MSYDDEQEPYVDPNSGLAPQPGGFGLNVPPVLGEDEEDPNPDEGGAEAVLATDGQQLATPVDEDHNPIVEDDLDDADPDDDLEDPNPDPGGADAELADGSEAVHDHAVETQAAGDGSPAPSEDPNPDPGGAEAELAPENSRAPQHEELDTENSRAPEHVDGTSADEAPDAQPGADEQVQGPEATDVPVEPAPAVEEPGRNASRSAWVEFARSKGAPEEELAEDGGLKRDELADKYGTASA